MKPIYLALLFASLPALASAQVIFHQAALDQLAGIAPPAVSSPAPVLHQAEMPRVHKRAAPKPVMVAAKPAVAPSATAPAPTPTPAVPPVLVPPVVKLPPPAPVTVNFAAGGTDLPADAAASLKPICDRAGATGLVGIDAYAAPDHSDISGPMRLSLTRALAVRDALTGCGVPAAHIIPRADGAVAGHASDSATVSLGTATGTAK